MFNKSIYSLALLGLCWMLGHAAVADPVSMRLVGPTSPTGIERYTLNECKRVFASRLNIQLSDEGDGLVEGRVVMGTPENNLVLARLVKSGFLKPETHAQGYSIKSAPDPDRSGAWLLAIAGFDEAGALYGLRDLEHFEMDQFVIADGHLAAKPFVRRDYPRIEYRGHWVWGCNMPDKKAWLDQMSQWKMNELIHWDNYVPKRAKEYVDYAHDRGIRVIWGFGWGWNPDWNFTVPKEFDRGIGEGVLMCGSDDFNKAFFKREILRKIREDYVPSGCDGVYFQSFTEGPKCQCSDCQEKSMGAIMLEFVNPLVDAIKKEFPDLWVSCGIHANFGKYDELKQLDPRCNIYWENCPSGTSVRGQHEDFGYINKSLPYGHGFSKTCPADPEYTEDSLKKWMDGNAHRYALQGDINAYSKYMAGLQAWSRKMLGKPSVNKHGTTVADHSVFCRRTPFMHVALAEAMWNPDVNPDDISEQLVRFLQKNGGVPGFKKKSGLQLRTVQHDAIGKKVSLKNPSSERYTGGGQEALADGRRAILSNARDAAWVGFERQNLDAVVALGTSMSINNISAGFLNQPAAGVHFPKEVEYAISRDGRNFKVVGTVKNPESSKSDVRKTYRLDGLDLYKVTYLRVRAKFVKHWLFVDEIMINSLQQDEP